MPRAVKADLIAAARALDWSVADWLLAAAAEHGTDLRAALDELDGQTVACGLNRCAFVTSVARLALGEELETVVASLLPPTAMEP